MILMGAVAGARKTDLGAPPTHRYWRVYITDNNGSALDVAFAELEMRESRFGPNLCSPAGTHLSGGGGSDANTVSNLFDGTLGNYWKRSHSSSPLPAYAGYDFGGGNEKQIVCVILTAREGTLDDTPKTFDIQWSDDGSAWTTAWSVVNEGGWRANEARVTVDPTYTIETYSGSPHGSHAYWRFYACSNNGAASIVSLAGSEFRSVPGVPQPSTGGTATASNEVTGDADNLFDSDPTTNWITNAGVPQRVTYQHSSPRSVAELMIRARGTSHHATETPKDVQVYYSDDGSTWSLAWRSESQTGWGPNEIRRLTDPEYLSAYDPYLLDSADYSDLSLLPNVVALTNPGFETGSTTGWTTLLGTGPTALTAPSVGANGSVQNGLSYVRVGASANNWWGQTVSLPAGLNDLCDAGLLQMAWAGWYATWSGDDDVGSLLVDFFDGSSNWLGEARSSVLASSPDTWSQWSLSGPIPAGTRSIRVSARGLRNNGTNCDCYFDSFDSVRITLTTRKQRLSTPFYAFRNFVSADWTNVSGTVTSNGSYYNETMSAWIAQTADRECYKDITLPSGDLTTIDQGDGAMLLSVQFNQMTDGSDNGNVILEFQDASNVHMTGYDVNFGNINIFSALGTNVNNAGHVRKAETAIPAGARKVRVRILADYNSGANNDTGIFRFSMQTVEDYALVTGEFDMGDDVTDFAADDTFDFDTGA